MHWLTFCIASAGISVCAFGQPPVGGKTATERELELLRKENESLRRENELLRRRGELLKKTNDLLEEEKESLRKKYIDMVEKYEPLGSFDLSKGKPLGKSPTKGKGIRDPKSGDRSALPKALIDWEKEKGKVRDAADWEKELEKAKDAERRRKRQPDNDDSSKNRPPS